MSQKRGEQMSVVRAALTLISHEIDTLHFSSPHGLVTSQTYSKESVNKRKVFVSKTPDTFEKIKLKNSDSSIYEGSPRSQKSPNFDNFCLIWRLFLGLLSLFNSGSRYVRPQRV